MEAAAAALVHASACGKGGTNTEAVPANASGLAAVPRVSKRKRAEQLPDAQHSPASPDKKSHEQPQMPSIQGYATDADGQRMWRQDQRRTEVKHGRSVHARSHLGWLMLGSVLCITAGVPLVQAVI